MINKKYSLLLFLVLILFDCNKNNYSINKKYKFFEMVLDLPSEG